MDILSSHKMLVPTEEVVEDFVDDSNLEVNVVLTVDAMGKFAAYMGVGRDKWVAQHGKKLTCTEALQYFPHIDKKCYRR